MRSKVDHLGDLAGTLYSWNTVGSLLGALLGGYLLLFFLDLHEVYRVATAVLVVAALILTWRVFALRAAWLALAMPLVAAIAVLPPWDPDVLYSGLFRRHGSVRNLFAGARDFVLPQGGRFAPETLFHEDDPTASVVVREFHYPNGGRSRSLSTNGKSDGDSLIDYATTGLIGILPALFAEKAETAFAIGWGLGITAGELASLESIERVDVAEISPAVMEAAAFFDFANGGASKNAKISVIESDAYRALIRAEGNYDVIVSQPSHLWVAGVEMLFSREFLEATRRKLSPGGVYCQYAHLYEIDDESLSVVLRTFASVYEHSSVWFGENETLLLLGFADPHLATDHFRLEARAARPDFEAALARAGIDSFPKLLAYEVLPLDALSALPRAGPVQSLYHPRLNALVARALFRGDDGQLRFSGFGQASQIGRKNSLLRAHAGRYGGRLPDAERADVLIHSCRALGPLCNTLLAEWRAEDPDSPHFARALEQVGKSKDGLSRDRIDQIAKLFEGSSAPREATSVAEAEVASRDFVSFYHHAAPFSAERLLDVWSRCRAEAPSEESCRQWAANASGAPSGADSDELLEKCLATVSIGPECEAGLRWAQGIVEEGSSAPALTALEGGP
jgi:spermidine synthase